MYLARQHHIAIIVSDWGKAKEFYIDKLGFELFREVYRPEQEDYLRYLSSLERFCRETEVQGD